MITTSFTADAQKPTNNIPIHSARLWVTLVFGLIVVMGLSMLKDWWLTGDEPNIWFYLIVPAADMFGTAVFMFLFARLFRQKPIFLEYLAITMGITIIMQTMEIITKLVYYKVWAYPGWLYFVFVFPLWFILITYALVRFTKLKWAMALSISVLGFIGSLLVGGLFTEIIGLETPGS
jgi:hypothetical protein